MLLHGWPDDRTLWRHQVSYLSRLGYRVLSVDWIGHGESSIPHDTKRYRIHELGADTIALLDALSIKQVHLVAHDYGATVSWETVANYPDRFLSYCALSVGHSAEIIRDVVCGHTLRYSWLVLHGLDRLSRYWYLSNNARQFRRNFASHPDAPRILAKLTGGEDQRFWTIWERANPSPSVLYHQFITGQRKKRITVPTMGIYSRDDEWMTEGQLARSGQYVDAVWQYARTKGGHWFPLECPQEVNTLLGTWLSNISGGNILEACSRAA